MVVVVIGSLMVTACGNDAGVSESEEKKVAQLTASTLGAQTVLTIPEYLATAQFATADRRKGEQQAQICKACHSFNEGGPNLIGPALFDMFGNAAGQQSDFEYSDAMLEASFTWTPRALDAWLAQPGSFLPGNKMSFGGVFMRSDRDNLIAYLLEATSNSDATEQ